MKNLFYTLILGTIILISACQKEGVNNTTPLTGSWKLREAYLSIGGPLIKRTDTDTSLYVKFNFNGTLGGNAYPGFTQYAVIDTGRLSLAKADNTSLTYFYSIRHDTLTMGNIGCVEGCPMKFVKQK